MQLQNIFHLDRLLSEAHCSGHAWIDFSASGQFLLFTLIAMNCSDERPKTSATVGVTEYSPHHREQMRWLQTRDSTPNSSDLVSMWRCCIQLTGGT